MMGGEDLLLSGDGFGENDGGDIEEILRIVLF
jgi:hypothetical protein